MRPPASPPKTSKRQTKFLKQQLARYGFTSYAKYLFSPEWRDVKERYRASEMPQKCIVCFDPNVDLHHKTYKRLGEEKLTDLVPLCRSHHEQLHDERLSLWRGPDVLRVRARANHGGKGKPRLDFGGFAEQA